MGGCSGKQESKNEPQLSTSSALPEFYYLYREQGRVLYITNKGIKKIEFATKLEFAKDSTVCALNKGKFLVVGGSRNSEFLQEVVFADAIAKEITQLSPLPVPTLGGYLFPHESWIYFVGGLVRGKSGLETAPLMRYSPSLNSWQIFNENFSVDEEKKDGAPSQSSIRSRRDFHLKNLLHPGCCLLENKIFFVGGQRKSTSGKLKSSKYVYSLDLSTEDFTLKMENIKMPCKLINPTIAAGTKHAILAGGQHPKTGLANKNSYYLSLREENPKFTILDGISFELKEHYPSFATSEHAVFISFPKVAVRRKDATNWYVYDIQHKHKKTSKTEIEASGKIKAPKGIQSEVDLNIQSGLGMSAENNKKGKNSQEVNKKNFDKSGNLKIPVKPVIGIKKGTSSSDSKKKSGKYSANFKNNVPGISGKGAISSKNSKKKGNDSDSDDSNKNKAKVAIAAPKLVIGNTKKRSSSDSSKPHEPVLTRTLVGFFKISTSSDEKKKKKGKKHEVVLPSGQIVIDSSSSSKKKGKKGKIVGPSLAIEGKKGKVEKGFSEENFEIKKKTQKVEAGFDDNAEQEFNFEGGIDLNSGNLPLKSVEINPPKLVVGKKAKKFSSSSSDNRKKAGIKIEPKMPIVSGSLKKKKSSSSSKKKKRLAKNVDLSLQKPKEISPKLVLGKKTENSSSSSTAKKKKAGIKIEANAGLPFLSGSLKKKNSSSSSKKRKILM